MNMSGGTAGKVLGAGHERIRGFLASRACAISRQWDA
jgi:hypothetical protein